MKLLGIGLGMLMMGGVCLAQGVKPTGTIDRSYWLELGGGLDLLAKYAAGEKAPSGTDQLKSFQAVSWDNPAVVDDFADNYGQVVKGYLIPPKSGKYTFYISSDDNSVLLLSTDADPKNAKQIARVPDWTSTLEWTKLPEQKSAAIALEAGKVYYIEARQQEGGGGDNLAVGWVTPEAAPEAAPAIIPGAVLSSFKAGVPTAK